MKKYILGAGIGALLMLGGTVLGATKADVGLHFVEEVGNIYKYYDRDANVICYKYWSNSISCLKNN